jgi:hypothetical protein
MSTLTYIAFFSNRCVFASGIDFHMVGEIEWIAVSFLNLAETFLTAKGLNGTHVVTSRPALCAYNIP